MITGGVSIGSFRVYSIGCWGGLLLFIFAVIGFSLPLGFALWYLYGGGDLYERTHRLEALQRQDPEQNAQAAIDRQDYRLYVICRETSNVMEDVCQDLPAKYQDSYGSRSLWVIAEADMNEEYEALNRGAIRYAAVYNLYILEHVPIAEAARVRLERQFTGSGPP